MTITTLSSRDLNMDLGRAKRAASIGPVIITDRGKPAHVLMSYEQYQAIIGPRENIVEALGLPEGVENIDFAPHGTNEKPGPIDLS